MRRPWILASVTWAYIAWSLVPLAVALSASLDGRPFGTVISFESFRFALRDPGLRHAFVQSAFLALATVAIAVPLGTALGIALAHLEGRLWRTVRATALALIAIPHAALGVIFLYLVAFVVPLPFDTPSQLLGHITLALPFVALIVWTRVLFLDPSYEEQAADLGAPPWSAVVRVLLPLSLPAIVVAAAVAFTVSFNELPVSRYLCLPEECFTVPMLLGTPDAGEVPPPLFALGLTASAISLVVLSAMFATLGLSRRRT